MGIQIFVVREPVSLAVIVRFEREKIGVFSDPRLWWLRLRTKQPLSDPNRHVRGWNLKMPHQLEASESPRLADPK